MSIAYECDRCHRIGTGQATWFQFAWSGRVWGESVDEISDGHLCIVCGSEFREWMKDGAS